MLTEMLTISLLPSRLTTTIENPYSLNGIKPVTVVILTLPSTSVKGIPIGGNTSISIADIGDDPGNPVSQERDTSLSPMLDTNRLVTGSAG